MLILVAITVVNLFVGIANISNHRRRQQPEVLACRRGRSHTSHLPLPSLPEQMLPVCI
jgi:hypothetical protein